MVINGNETIKEPGIFSTDFLIDQNPLPVYYTPTLRYSKEEEIWIQSQLNKFDTAWRKIPLGEEQIKEFLMYSLDVPLSKGYMAKSMATFVERYRMVLKIHPEFNNLNQYQQEAVWKASSCLAVGVICAKLESCKTGNEQLAFAEGNETNSWIFQMTNKQKLKKLTMDMANVSTGIFSEPELENFGRLVKEVGDLIQDQETFKLFTLALLFSCNEVSIPEIKLLKDTYLNVIRRRRNLDVDFMHQNESSNEKLAFGHLEYSRFN